MICKEFIEKNNVSPVVESELGKGSIFVFTVQAYKETVLQSPDQATVLCHWSKNLAL